MPNRMLTPVNLPHLTPEVLLPNRLADTLQRIMDGGDEGTTSIELIEAGLFSARNNVSQLRKCGAMIKTKRNHGFDRHGEHYTGIAYYIYLGWHYDLPLY